MPRRPECVELSQKNNLEIDGCSVHRQQGLLATQRLQSDVLDPHRRQIPTSAGVSLESQITVHLNDDWGLRNLRLGRFQVESSTKIEARH